MAHQDTVIRYFEGCTSGNVELMRTTLHPEVVHYFLAPNVGSAPVAGAEHLARYWRKVRSLIDARWAVDHLLASGDEAVIEWTMFWLPRGHDQRIATRGTEWYIFRDGLISEIRSYHQQRDRTTELDGFPYPERGYSGLDAAARPDGRSTTGKAR